MSRTLASDIDDFLQHGTARGLKPATISNYQHHLGVCLRILRRRGCRRWTDVTPTDLDAVMATVLEEKRKKSSRINCAVLLKEFCGWLVERGRVARDPSRLLAIPDDGEPDLAEPPLSEAEVAALFASLPRETPTDLRFAALLEVLYGAALRIGEAVGLDLDDIDATARTLTVRGGKGGQDRVVALTATALAAVQDWLTVRRTLLKGPDHGALFIAQPRGGRWQRASVYKWFADLNARRGPDLRHIHPHLLRHSIAVHLLRGGVGVRLVQDMLGHASIDSTKNYLRLVPGHLKADYDKAMPRIATGLPPAAPQGQGA